MVACSASCAEGVAGKSGFTVNSVRPAVRGRARTTRPQTLGVFQAAAAPEQRNDMPGISAFIPSWLRTAPRLRVRKASSARAERPMQQLAELAVLNERLDGKRPWEARQKLEFFQKSKATWQAICQDMLETDAPATLERIEEAQRKVHPCGISKSTNPLLVDHTLPQALSCSVPVAVRMHSTVICYCSNSNDSCNLYSGGPRDLSGVPRWEQCDRHEDTVAGAAGRARTCTQGNNLIQDLYHSDITAGAEILTKCRIPSQKLNKTQALVAVHEKEVAKLQEEAVSNPSPVTLNHYLTVHISYLF